MQKSLLDKAHDLGKACHRLPEKNFGLFCVRQQKKIQEIAENTEALNIMFDYLNAQKREMVFPILREKILTIVQQNLNACDDKQKHRVRLFINNSYVLGLVLKSLKSHGEHYQVLTILGFQLASILNSSADLIVAFQFLDESDRVLAYDLLFNDLKGFGFDMCDLLVMLEARDLPSDFYQSKSFMLLAIQQNAAAFLYASDALQKEPSFIRDAYILNSKITEYVSYTPRDEVSQKKEQSVESQNILSQSTFLASIGGSTLISDVFDDPCDVMSAAGVVTDIVNIFT